MCITCIKQLFYVVMWWAYVLLLMFFLFRHEISELRGQIAVKLCHVIGRFFRMIN